jgi:hypothetical protein
LEAAQRARWMRPDAYRWIRPDTARFLTPGTHPYGVYPALQRKFSPDQPRVPAGNPDGGQWTDGGGGIDTAFPTNLRRERSDRTRSCCVTA